MATLNIRLRYFPFRQLPPNHAAKPSCFRKSQSLSHFRTFLQKPTIRRPVSGSLSGNLSVVRRSNAGDEENSIVEVKSDRPPFDLNLAVVLAGFAFEAYSTPPDNVGWREIDAAECQTVFLSEQFLREVYDGRLFIKLKKGENFPAMDPWGTSDPYVVLQLDSQVTKSKVKWATKDPIWNEDHSLNIKTSRTNILQVAAWDANLVTPHKRMGNAGLNLESLCDGTSREIVVELGGIGGGGKILLESVRSTYGRVDSSYSTE